MFGWVKIHSLKLFRQKKKNYYLLITSQVSPDFQPQFYIFFKSVAVFCGDFTEKDTCVPHSRIFGVVPQR